MCTLLNPIARLVLLAGLALLFPGCNSSSTQSNSEEPAETMPLAEVASGAEASSEAATPSESVTAKLVDYAGVMEFVSENRGKVIVLDIWSTACVPCMREFPNLVALGNQQSPNLVCISLNIDYIGLKKKPAESYVPRVEEFLTSQAAGGIVNFIANEPDELIRDKFGVTAIPAIIVFNAEGEIAQRLTDATASGQGLTYEADVLPAVKALLE